MSTLQNTDTSIQNTDIPNTDIPWISNKKNVDLKIKIILMSFGYILWALKHLQQDIID